MMKKEQYANLSRLLGCYFHQDWNKEFLDSNHALEEIVKCEPASCLRDSVKEIEYLLSQPMTETDYSELMASTVGCYFEPSSEHTHYSDWLSKIAIYFKSQR
ncbi:MULTISPECIES: contact-dependent growth inhibition system immunity protein [Pseudomonas syringae group]|nr:contact-dependent growth inhibition system immunity protein [Pseudomonas syringae group genomosp. 3]MBI6846937.1 hypothetical protein [Pseudomonas syringae]MBX6511437.1 hypothetical protein [Pseudomonas syringae pv. tomato]TES61221.1 hypothetical protein E2N91_02545 [Pseudomonas syringae pv. tomato]TES80780.1 hypothetical protein E2N89_00735 [Pseudomonas syringae pv. tomato]